MSPKLFIVFFMKEDLFYFHSLEISPPKPKSNDVLLIYSWLNGIFKG